jgi:hypothetical protein
VRALLRLWNGQRVLHQPRMLRFHLDDQRRRGGWLHVLRLQRFRLRLNRLAGVHQRAGKHLGDRRWRLPVALVALDRVLWIRRLSGKQLLVQRRDPGRLRMLLQLFGRKQRLLRSTSVAGVGLRAVLRRQVHGRHQPLLRALRLGNRQRWHLRSGVLQRRLQGRHDQRLPIVPTASNRCGSSRPPCRRTERCPRFRW